MPDTPAVDPARKAVILTANNKFVTVPVVNDDKQVIGIVRSCDIVDLLSIELIGAVPDDEFIITQTNKGEPAVINKKAPSGKAYLEIARRILGENVEVTIPGRDEGFFTKIKDIFRKK